MSTIITAANHVVLDPVTMKRVVDLVSGNLYTTYEVYDNFASIATNRPKSWLLNLIEFDKVDTVIQLGFDGHKTEIVRVAEDLGLDVYLFNRVDI